MPVKEEVILLFCIVLSSFLVAVTSALAIHDLFRDDQQNNLIVRNSTVIQHPTYKLQNEIDWKFRKFCISEVAKNVCMEVGMPTNGSGFPKTLRISRDLGSRKSSETRSKKYRRAKENDDSKADYVSYGDEKDVMYDDHGYKEDHIGDENLEKAGEVEYYDDYENDKKNSCKVPKYLKTVEMWCKMWPSSISCKSYCVYGSTFHEGIVRTHTCEYKKNKWSPEFEECKPFIDCSARIKSPGKIKCVRNEIQKSPACQISCEIFEDKDEVKSKIYQCKSDGTWQPPLPFCAERKGIINLVSAPHIKEHLDLQYP